MQVEIVITPEDGVEVDVAVDEQFIEEALKAKFRIDRGAFPEVSATIEDKKAVE